jgi:two-component system, OmpR family, sensor histidine kinase KdpD
MENAGSLLAKDRGWAAAPTFRHAVGATLFLGIAALTTHLTADRLPHPTGLFLFFVAVLLAAVRFGFWVGIASAVSAFALFNFLFVQPLYTFAVAKSADFWVLAEFLAVAGLTGFLAGRLREEANAATSRAAILEVLSGFAAHLAQADGPEAINAALLRHTQALALGPALVLQPQRDGQLGANFASPDIEAADLQAPDLQAAERAFRRRSPQDSTQPGQEGGRFAFLPLIQDGEVALLLGYHRLAPERADRAAREQAIEVICGQANLAIERLRFAKIAEAARIGATRDALRAALLTSLSHDLRTPLATILGAITSLRQLADTLPLSARDDLALAIEEEARRLAHYVDNLLQMTRLQAGVEVHLAWVDCTDVARAAIARAQRAFPAAQILMDLPELPMIRAEAALLEQALFNLLDNAIKFSPKAAPIAVTAQATSTHIALTVTDQGPGIAPQIITELFKPFFRADPRQTGTGLGLTISSGIAQALHGSLTATSPVAAGRGSAFCIMLPQCEPSP